MSDLWKHKDCWKRAGKDFMVEVSRHSSSITLDPFEGEHLWCVYAYIYPKHPHFTKFDGPNMWQDATQVMPLHAGASLLEFPMYEGKVTCARVGSDYNHLHDDYFKHCATKEDAREVFNDADDLFNWLSERSAKATEAA